ncbi:MAG: hypothetical protein OXG05_06240 [Gammaproteobacteria bacterium]|nr:hypothetical protein [Gammaproteobacteria bacterium]
MNPAVSYYDLPKLRRAIEHDLPTAPHGLRATWQEMLDLRRKFLADPDFTYMPTFPTHRHATTIVATDQLLRSRKSSAVH